MARGDIAVIGRLANGTAHCDGQTVKTRALYDALKTAYPARRIRVVDMYRWKRRILPILWQTLCAFVTCEHIFVLFSRNGRKWFFPLINGLNRLFHRRIYHAVVGSSLTAEAKASPALCKQLARFSVNWVEFAGMRDDLAALGIDNAAVLPNFKNLPMRTISDVRMWSEDRADAEPYDFVMFSRVMREKGVTDAIHAIAQINRDAGKTAARLLIRGPVEGDYRAEFDALCEEHRGYVDYRGVCPADESTDVLLGAFALLFPTTYRGEGMPGTVIDAFASGIPVIATDWHFNGALIAHGKTGYLYDPESKTELSRLIRYAIDHPAEVDGMRAACLAEAVHYTPASAMKIIQTKLTETESV